MVSNLLFFLAVSSSCWNYPGALNEKACIESNPFKKFWVTLSEYKKHNPIALDELKPIFSKDRLSSTVINKLMNTLECTYHYNIEYNPILTIIDYSLPSNEKRMWIYDLIEKKLLFHTYVAHGITSGSLLTEFFSNKYNSKASSIGVYKTAKSYWGRDGLSLRLTGLDTGFNDNASGRAIVMHGGWYVAENFIKKYGRPGRSWGCPAIPQNLTKEIINTIKDNSLFVVYYPTENWFENSKYLNCHNFVFKPGKLNFTNKPFLPLEDKRDDVLFTDVDEKNESVLTMPVDIYEKVFASTPPVNRMLRRQINNREFIALSVAEFNSLANSNSASDTKYNAIVNELYFVTPEIKMERGYYKTHMKIIPLGKIKSVELNSNTNEINLSNNNQIIMQSYIVNFEQGSIKLKAVNKFIRWLGL